MSPTPASSASSSSPSHHVPSQLRHALRTSLRPARSSRSVFEFLFQDLTTSPFHPSYLLPPSSFHHALSLSDVTHLHPIPNPMYPPVASTLHVPFPDDLVTFDPPPHSPLRSFHHVIYLPVASHLPHHIFGYALFHDPTHSTVCFRANPYAPPVAARFVYDINARHLLMTVYSGIPKTIGIRAIVNTNTCTEHYLIPVQPLDYTWPNLPDTPLWMFSHIEYRTLPPLLLSSSASSSYSSSQQNKKEEDDHVSASPYTPPQDYLHALDGTIPCEPFPSRRCASELPSMPTTPSYLPFVLRPDGTLTDGTCPPLSPVSDTAGYIFDTQQLTMGMQQLCALLTGSFYTPSMRADTVEPLIPPSEKPPPSSSSSSQPTSLISSSSLSLTSPTAYRSTFTGRIVTTISVTNTVISSRLRQRFASVYYAHCLSVPSNLPVASVLCDQCTERAKDEQLEHEIGALMPHMEGLNKQVLQQLIDESMSFWTSPTKTRDVVAKTGSLKRIVPRPRPQPQQQQQQQQQERTQVVQYASREEMLAARRARNRLSAARSNERKKEWIENLEREVQERRQLIARLEKRHDEVMDENRALKSQLWINSFIER